ncbi:hypothetical protein ABZ649_32040 [Streptomyces albidoflavus]|uniref:hypothetical protein n=1 Tax=Streptomyces TaxID=1883 RepID=UPI001BE93F35|nr:MULTISPECIES: hypothetical protein [unclassified Streptomyces]WSB18108.1 hypothetical protein OHB37_29845 [Streptomyces albidoflavus]MBT2878568.1 hypothetical protein [Streptomyces sp. McG6]MBT2886119.1 hypothetical protein [Streptomyces sp. McG5]MBT2889267.1 hypothetical protein [Streptomyces sp. McG2]MEE1721568.1 hypothetical protein [Streptomyces sp. JV186]
MTVGLVAGICLASSGPAAAASSSVIASSGELMIKCEPASSPSTAHAKFWWDGGITTTTIHYTNPCNSMKSATARYVDGDNDKYACIAAFPKTTGSKKISHGLIGAVKKVTEGC